MIIFASLSCLVTAAFLFYLASPNQLLVERCSIKKPTSVRALLVAFVLLVTASFIALIQVLGKPTSAFVIFVVLMLVWTLVPFIITAVKPQKKTARAYHAKKAH